jgi:hypothetical protein
MDTKPEKEHRWLHKLAGDWTYETECNMGPDKPAEKFSGTETVRLIGDLWIQGEGHGEMPAGSPAITQMTLGYDPQKKRFVGTWIGSMMSYLWVYDGWLDASETILTLAAEGPSFAGDGTMAKYEDIVEIKSDDHRMLKSRVLGEDGKWNEFLVGHYRRKK